SLGADGSGFPECSWMARSVGSRRARTEPFGALEECSACPYKTLEPLFSPVRFFFFGVNRPPAGPGLSDEGGRAGVDQPGSRRLERSRARSRIEGGIEHHEVGPLARRQAPGFRIDPQRFRAPRGGEAEDRLRIDRFGAAQRALDERRLAHFHPGIEAVVARGAV